MRFYFPLSQLCGKGKERLRDARLRRRVRGGDGAAMLTLALRRHRAGRADEAQALYQRAAKAGVRRL